MNISSFFFLYSVLTMLSHLVISLICLWLLQIKVDDSVSLEHKSHMLSGFHWSLTLTLMFIMYHWWC